MSIERQVARYMADVADAIQNVKTGETTYGEFYVSSVSIGFDGEDTGYRIIPNEHGDYDIAEETK
jgi:hypothetical protein